MSDSQKRATFLKMLVSDLDRMIENVELRLASRRLDDEDFCCLTKIRKFLINGLIEVYERQIEILQQRIDEKN